MKLRFARRAVEDISHIADYLQARNPRAAQRVRADIYDGLQDLILFPLVGRLQRTEGVRKFVTRRYAYLIYYSVDSTAEEIVVLSVKHSAQKREHDDA
jgi:toxin ParE1/3/4